jgi:hypothetical protein
MQNFADANRHQRHGAILKNVDDFDGLERQLKLRFTMLQKLGAPGGFSRISISRLLLGGPDLDGGAVEFFVHPLVGHYKVTDK